MWWKEPKAPINIMIGGADLWNGVKEFVKGVGRRLGLIQHLGKVENHKRINVNELEYREINFNKRLYQGDIPEWHNLRYMNTNRRMVERKQMSLGMPKIIAEKMASLVFNEGVVIELAKDSEKTEQWDKVKGVIASAKFKSEFQRYLEYMFAMGGVVVEVYLDGDTPKIAYATADAVFPISQDTETIDEIVIANQFTDNGRVYTLLKWHEWDNGVYQITNELYESGDYDALGDKVKLSKMFPDMEAVSRLQVNTPLFHYIKPNIANNKNIISPLGVSIFGNAQDTIRMLDTMYDFWYNEFRLGKRRVAVPEYLVKTGSDIHGNPYSYFDDSEELFVALNGGEMESMEVKDLTVDIRSEQVINSIQSLLDILSMQVGLSPGTFTFAQGGIKTATQVVSEQSETFRTRSSHLLVIEEALRSLILSIYEVVDLTNDETEELLERDDITIDFNDGVFLDTNAQLDFYSKLHSTGGYPLYKVLMKVLNMSEEDAKQTVAEARAEQSGRIVDIEQAVQSAQIEV